jgi:hypothetical protein
VNQERSAAELKLLLAKAESEITRMAATIAGLEEELNMLRGNPPLVKPSADNNNLSTSPTAAEALPSISRLQSMAS